MAASPTKTTHERQEGRCPLLDDEGELTPKFEDALAYIFQKYSTVSPSPSSSAAAGSSTYGPSTPSRQTGVDNDASARSPRKATPALGSRPPKGAIITDVALDHFAYDTNGAPFPQESKDELKTFMECDEQRGLTVSGLRWLGPAT